MSKTFFWIYIAITSLLITTFVVYITVNTVLVNKATANVSILGQDYSLLVNNETQLSLNEQIISSLPVNLEVSADGYHYTVPTRSLDIYIGIDNLEVFKGEADALQLIGNLNQYLQEQQIEAQISLNPLPIVENYPLKIQNDNAAYIDNGALKNCKSGNYNFEINNERLTDIATRAVKDDYKLSFSLTDILVNPKDIEIIEHCKKYLAIHPLMQRKLQELIDSSELNIQPNLEYDVTSESPWRYQNLDSIKTALLNLKKATDIQYSEGKFEVHDDVIWLLEAYRTGKSLNVEQTIHSLSTLLHNSGHNPEIIYDYQVPKLANTKKRVYDFTKFFASGRSRIDLIRFRRPNPSVRFAQAGVEEMHNYLIMPGTEFALSKVFNQTKPGISDDGRPIGSGTSNSATTIFRAALEAGFPITDRSAHGFYVPSYEWPYPKDLVDATYFWKLVDLKFINDLQYPIVLKTEVRREKDYQYHTINIYTDPRTPSREVVLKNWQRSNVATGKIYSSTFERAVYQDGIGIRKDKFTQDYKFAAW